MSDYFIHPIDKPLYRPAPGTTESRRDTPWNLMDVETLFFAYELLSLHQSPFLGDLLYEIDRRDQDGNAIDLEKPPPPLTDLPQWMRKFPFNLLWKQRPR